MQQLKPLVGGIFMEPSKRGQFLTPPFSLTRVKREEEQQLENSFCHRKISSRTQGNFKKAKSPSGPIDGTCGK
jgi:hypothetical protein